MSDGGNVKEEIGGTAERGVNGHGVADAALAEDIAHFYFTAFEFNNRASRADGDVGPDRLTRRRERGMWDAERRSGQVHSATHGDRSPSLRMGQ